MAAVMGSASIAITAVVLPRRSRPVPLAKISTTTAIAAAVLLVTITITDEKKEASMNDPKASTSAPMLTEIVMVTGPPQRPQRSRSSWKSWPKAPVDCIKAGRLL